MANTLFDLAGELLENQTGFDRLEARGTLRIALKGAGLDPSTITLEQLGVVFAKVMPAEFEKRGLQSATALAKNVFEEIQRSAAASGQASTASVDGTFRRLGGD